MSKDIVSILTKKKNITGDDIGKLLIADMSEEMIHFKQTKELKSIISQDEFNRLLNSIKGNYQTDRYNHYVTIHNTIRSYFMAHQYLMELATGKLAIHEKLLDNIIGSMEQDIIKYRSPLIMTEAQYNKALKECAEEVNKEVWNYAEVLLNYFCEYSFWYLKRREEEPETTPKNKELEAIIEQYKKEPIKNKDLKDLYYSYNYETKAEGYFTFKDEWLMGDTREEFLEELGMRNLKPIEENLQKYTAKDLKKELDEHFIRDILTEEQIEEKFTYTLYPKPPKEIYKADLMDADFIYYSYNTETKDKTEQEEVIKHLKNFMKELPEYTDFILKEIEKTKGLDAFKGIDIKDAFKVTQTGADLKKTKAPFFDYERRCFDNFKDKYPQADYSGLALIKEEVNGFKMDGYELDEDGNYKNNAEKDYGILLTTQQDAFKEVLEETDILKKIGLEENVNIQGTFYNALLQVNAHNTFIEILADVLGLPNLKEAFCFSLDDLKKEVKTLNLKLDMLLNVHAQFYARSGYYEKAKQLRKNIFKLMPYLDLSKADITPENRQRAEEYISEIKNFKGISATTKPLYILEGAEV